MPGTNGPGEPRLVIAECVAAPFIGSSSAADLEDLGVILFGPGGSRGHANDQLTPCQRSSVVAQASTSRRRRASPNRDDRPHVSVQARLPGPRGPTDSQDLMLLRDAVSRDRLAAARKHGPRSLRSASPAANASWTEPKRLVHT